MIPDPVHVSQGVQLRNVPEAYSDLRVLGARASETGTLPSRSLVVFQIDTLVIAAW